MNTQPVNPIFPPRSDLCREPAPPMSEPKRGAALLGKQGSSRINLRGRGKLCAWNGIRRDGT